MDLRIFLKKPEKGGKTVQDIKDKKLFDNARSSKLQVSLERIPRRKMKGPTK